MNQRTFGDSFFIQGYYNNPEASKFAVDDDGFCKTGDVGYFNENGTLFVIDRKKEIMKCENCHVNPSEIENVIESIEGVELVSVVGMADPIAKDLPTAVIVKRNGFEHLTGEYVKTFVAQRLPSYKQLHGGVFFVRHLPMTPSGKIQKRLVKDLVAKKTLL